MEQTVKTLSKEECLIALSGECTTHTARNALITLTNDLIKKGFKYFIIDMSNVVFIDSVFLGGLSSIKRILVSVNGDIVLFGLNPHIYKIFDVTRLNRVFKIVNNLGAARLVIQEKLVQNSKKQKKEKLK